MSNADVLPTVTDAVSRGVAHSSPTLGLIAVIAVLVSAVIILLLPSRAWRALDRLALLWMPLGVWRLIAGMSHSDIDLGPPFAYDEQAGVFVEAEGLAAATWEPEAPAVETAIAEAPVADVAPVEPDCEPALDEVKLQEILASVREAAPARRIDVVDRHCKMDMAATKDGLELIIEVPGLEEKDVDIQVNNDVLTISGHLRFEPGGVGRTYRLMERDYGSFSRSIDLPEGVPADRIRAALNRGLLTISIPNPVRPAPKRIAVQAAPMFLADTGAALELTVDLPGLEEDEVELAVEAGVLTVRGERRLNGGGPVFGLVEPGPAAITRSIELPDGIDADQISAALSRGVLTVTIPNPVKPDPRRIKVQAAA